MVSSGLRRLAPPLRVLAILTLLLAPALAGCAAPEARPAAAPELRLLALDGRWPFDPARAEALVARAGAPAPVGALVFGEAMGERAAADHVGLDEAAARAFGLEPLAPGEALVTRAWAEREGAREGEALELRAQAHPDPYVATYFEMERTPPCERRPDAKLCFLPIVEEGVARLRLRVDEGARDAGFLPDLVELGPGARPAWWNGTFEGPQGERHAFTAHAPPEGNLTPAEFDGAMSAGEWIVSFRLETRHGVAPAGAAGIVRLREPGYLWFDDRLQQHTEAAVQARAVLANATATRAEVRVRALVDALPAGAQVALSLEDARALAGTRGVTALLVNWTDAHAAAVDAARGPDGVSLALRPRGLGDAAPPPARQGDLVFAAPAGIDVATLPPVEGAGAPALALAGRAPVGEAALMDGEPLGADVLLLAHADGPLPWSLPAGARWTVPQDALENLTRSRTLALASADLLAAPVATARIELGAGNLTRSMVAIGGVEGGPDGALWTSAALLAGVGRPGLARVLLPVEPGADRDEVARRALDAWAGHGVALDR